MTNSRKIMMYYIKVFEMREGKCFRNTGCWGLWYGGHLLAH